MLGIVDESKLLNALHTAEVALRTARDGLAELKNEREGAKVKSA